MIKNITDSHNDLHHAVQSLLSELMSMANVQFNTLYPAPTVHYNQRGSIAGSAHLQSWMIKLNPVLLIENRHAFIQEVVPHELAHLLVFKQFGRVPPHGKAWRWMMQTVLLRAPRRTHTFSLHSLQKYHHTYYCHCQIHQLSTIKHQRLQQNITHYFCKKCKSHLTAHPPN